jgi:hypothetical protein
MTTRVRTVMKLTAAFAVLAAFVGAAPPLHAQSKPSSSARIPFFSDAVGEPLNEREDTQIAVFKDEVPAGKRLVVQFVSVSGRGSVTLTDNDPPEELIFAKCHITGRGIGVDSSGNPRLVRHLLPLVSRRIPSQGTETFTAAAEVTIYLEPGPHGVLCSSGSSGSRFGGLEAFVTGELVSQ